jgi:hypothetical protein
MPYLTCPWCLVPQYVEDRAAAYQCFTCYGQIRFFACPHCTLVQTVSERWTAFTCERCQKKVDLPHRWSYDPSAQAQRVEGTGGPYPKL